jgi:hypothetical protein
MEQGVLVANGFVIMQAATVLHAMLCMDLEQLATVLRVIWTRVLHAWCSRALTSGTRIP